MSKSEKNLWEAFAGESQANRKYLAFAKQAEKEGHTQAAKLFRAAAEAETIHAHAHLRALKAVGETADNLRVAIAGETHEFENMYPAMIEAAKTEDHKQALRSFTFANEVEKEHAALFEKVLGELDSPVDADFHLCPVCGYTCEGEGPEQCPVCGAPRKSFYKVD